MHNTDERTNGPPHKTELNQVPRIKSHQSFFQITSTRILAVSDPSIRVLNGQIFSALLPTIDGLRPVRDIVKALDDQFAVEQVLFALRQLYDQKIVADVQRSPDPQSLGFWDSCETDATAVETALSKTVGVFLVGSIDPVVLETVVASLLEKGIQAYPSPDFGTYDLTLVLTDDYLRDELNSLNSDALKSGHIWALAKPTGRQLWIGPVFGQASQACWQCLARSLRDNRREQIVARSGVALNLHNPSEAWSSSAQQFGALIATQVALAMAAEHGGKLEDRVLSFDPMTFEAQHHAIRPRLNCQTCREHRVLETTDKARIKLQDHTSVLDAEGGRRVCKPEVTYQRLSPLISPICGIIPSEPICVERGGYHVAKCRQITPWRKGSNDLNFDLSLGAGGKGPSAIQARAGCLAEAVERYCGTFHGDEVCIQASFNDLTDRAVHPNAMQLYSQAQYQDRDANASKEPFWVPELFDEEEAIRWTSAWSLSHQHPVLVPTALSYFDTPKKGPDFCLADSNGCAAGNVLEEAVLHGLLELIERDALAIWWYNRLRRPAFDMSRLTSSVRAQIETLRGFLTQEGRRLSFIDLTNDLRVPVVGAIAWDENTGGRITFGFGAHLDASIAASRAASELVQLDVYCAEAAQSRLAPRMSYVKKWFETARIDTHPYLVPSDDSVPVLPPALAGENLKADIDHLVAHLARSDIEVLAVDLSRNDVDFSVARVFAPGLRHYHNRFAPGRLYDVPVELGWQDRPTAEVDLNPLVYFT